MRHLLVPLDGSGFGETALALAASRRRPQGSELELVTVHASTAHPDISATMSSEIETLVPNPRTGIPRQHGRAGAAPVQHRAAHDGAPRRGGNSDRRARHGKSPRAHRHEHPRSVRDPADSSWEAWPTGWFGSCTAHSSWCTPRRRRPTVELPAAARVLVPLDGSSSGRVGLGRSGATVLAGLATLHLVRAVDPVDAFPIGAPMPLPPIEPELIEVRRAAARAYLESTAWKLRQAGWHVEYEVVTEWTPRPGC